MGHTLTLEVPEDVYESLKRTAEQIGQPPEALAVQWLTTAIRNLVNDPLEKFIGAFSSHGSDWADHHDKYLGKSVAETMHSVEREGHPDA
ncbi:MAG: hypothetical protein MN733_23525 [Nitrososphaera sp.]|nr:hypothetical protein [Nitrososphaera sp.]